LIDAAYTIQFLLLQGDRTLQITEVLGGQEGTFCVLRIEKILTIEELETSKASPGSPQKPIRTAAGWLFHFPACPHPRATRASEAVQHTQMQCTRLHRKPGQRIFPVGGRCWSGIKRGQSEHKELH